MPSEFEGPSTYCGGNVPGPGPQAFGFLTNSRAVVLLLLLLVLLISTNTTTIRLWGMLGTTFFDRRGRRLVTMACYMGSRQYVPLITISNNFILVCSGGVEWFKHKQLVSSESWSQIGIQRTCEWSQIRTGAEKKKVPLKE